MYVWIYHVYLEAVWLLCRASPPFPFLWTGFRSLCAYDSYLSTPLFCWYFASQGRVCQQRAGGWYAFFSSAIVLNLLRGSRFDVGLIPTAFST